ncbi:MAG: FGGY family carbohydrate kinase, partial [Gemmatimonadota bacterium]|nr:FGGY family carbohydrate kinase [Gemmatimonadota bacterium]
MSRPGALIALDQGTTSTRAIGFDTDGRVLAAAQRELPQSFPRPGWVEHDAKRIRDDAIAVMREVLRSLEEEGRSPLAIGITNQRETAVVWDRATGEPIHPAIVWQDRRTSDRCRALAEAGKEPDVQARTGLLLDPYFSATKIAWILEHVPGVREAAADGDLAFGTIDTWLIWCLTGGDLHATDASNASRTLLFDIGTGSWSEEMLELFEVPADLLPEVRDSAGDFGATDAGVLGRSIPIRGVAGDQQAATFGQAGFSPGAMKCTYGWGAFALLNTGTERIASQHRLLTTVAWR